MNINDNDIFLIDLTQESNENSQNNLWKLISLSNDDDDDASIFNFYNDKNIVVDNNFFNDISHQITTTNNNQITTVTTTLPLLNKTEAEILSLKKQKKAMEDKKSYERRKLLKK